MEKEKYFLVEDAEDEDDDDIYISTESQNINITTSLLSTLSPAGAKRPLPQADDDSFCVSSSIDSDDISSSETYLSPLDF